MIVEIIISHIKSAVNENITFYAEKITYHVTFISFHVVAITTA